MRYITTSRVARELGRSESGVRKLADAGVLPVAATLSDGTRLFDPEAIARVRDQRTTPVPPANLASGVSTS